MSTFNLGLPTDIPWERICFTDDMVHAPICGTAPPPAWRPSIAVFKYEPDADYQTLLTDNKLKIAYLKIAVTITPDAPDVAVDHIKKFVSHAAVGQVGAAAACYGALLQVSVGPKGAGSASQIYFADFEPKKRELYEAVTDTGQFASGSQTRLAVGKSSMTSDSTESFSSATGGINVSVPISGATLSGGVSGTTGERSTQSAQIADTTTTDRSTERRELQSHTTQLSQMYNLFQAFHVGTNRAVFFMEPRPHVVQGEATFINGPRALEGIQEIFLVVVRPEAMDDFCVNATLETAHMNITATYFDDVDTSVVEFDHTAYPPSGTDPDNWGYDAKSITWTPPTGWVIDVEATKGEILNIYEDHPGESTKPGKAVIQSISPTSLVLRGEASWKTISGGLFAGNSTINGTLKFNLTVHLKPSKTSIRQYLDKIYFNVRNLCCCPTIDPTTETPITPDKPTPPCGPAKKFWDEFFEGWDPRTGKLVKWPIDQYWEKVRREVQNGAATPETLVESAEAADAIRKEMLKSLAGEGQSPCPTPFSQSDIFFTRVTDALQGNDAGTDLDKPLSKTTALPAEQRALLIDGLGDITLNQLLRTNSHEVAELLGKSLQETVLIKEQLLRLVTTPPEAPSTAATLGKVIGVRILSTYPDPSKLRLVAEVSDPHAIQIVDYTEQPNVIEIDFSDRPDEGALSAITVSSNGVALTTQAMWASATTARLLITSSLTFDSIHTINVIGTGSSAVSFKGKKLDGEPIAIPSGDGVEGGDFVCLMKVRGPAAVGTPTSIALLKVVGVEISSTTLTTGTTRLLASMADPASIMRIPASGQPNIIKILFNHQPDSGTVTSSSFQITKNGSTVGATVSLGTDQTATLTITDPIEDNANYLITLRGNGGSTIKYVGWPLDGEPYALPSGNGVGGGNFTFVMQTYGVNYPTPELPDQRLRILGARIMSSSPDPMNPRVLAEMIHPATVQLVNDADAADIIEVDFSEAPDTGTVTATSFTIGEGTAALTGTVTMPTTRTARLTLASPLASGKAYTATLLGTGSSAITWGSEPLDGDPITLPSGDGTAGGDFTFRVGVIPAETTTSALPLIRVKSLRVLSDYPDPDNLSLLTSSFHPSETMLASLAEQPNIIDVEFTVVPDTGTVTGTSFTIDSASGTVAHTVAMLNATTARMTITGTLTAGTTYTITVKGDGTSAVTYQTRKLDGEATGYPSGDGVEGGDFVVKMKVLA